MSVEEVLNLNLKELVDHCIAVTGMSQNDIAKGIEGVSSSMITQLKSGTYKGDMTNEEKVRKHISFLLKQNEKKVFEAPKLEFGYLRAARKKIENIIEDGHIALLQGNSGTGKTTLLEEFKEKLPNSVRIQAYKGMKRSELIYEIAKGLGESPKGKNLTTLVPFMKSKILIVDEANKLSGGSLEWLRSLQDRAKSPMIWGGTYEDITQIIANMPELKRRRRVVELRALRQGELKTLVESFEFSNGEIYSKKLWEMFNGDMGLSIGVLKDMKSRTLNNPKSDNIEMFEKVLEMMI